MISPDCYVIKFPSWDEGHKFYPAKVVSETKTTICVEAYKENGETFNKPITFIKDKTLNGYADPRTEWQTFLKQRGCKYIGDNYGLTFNFEWVEEVKSSQRENKKRQVISGLKQKVFGQLDELTNAGVSANSPVYIALKNLIEILQNWVFAQKQSPFQFHH